jgi:hypothetical protein
VPDDGRVSHIWSRTPGLVEAAFNFAASILLGCAATALSG